MMNRWHNRSMRRHTGLLISAALAVVIGMAQPGHALAHPLGNFTINRYSRLEVGRQLQLLYVVDMAEIPAFQEKTAIDTNQDGVIGAAEREQYLVREADVLQSHLQVSVNGAPIALKAMDSSLDFPSGQGGLQTERLTIRFAAAWPGDQNTLAVDYRDDNFADRIGWQEVVVQAADGVQLNASDAPSQDVSDELRNYPQDLLQSPSKRHTATFRFQPVTTPTSGASSAQPAAISAGSLVNPQKSTDPFTALISIPSLGLGAILLALAAAFVWGGLHALTPGHGKTIVAAYLVGSRGTIGHAVFLGLTTTITHTAGVFALGLLTLFASRYILPEQLYPWLGVISGLLVAAIGLSLFRGRLAKLIRREEHGHDPMHLQDLAPALDHAQRHDHVHAHELQLEHTHVFEREREHMLAHEHGLAHRHDHDHESVHQHAHDLPHAHTHSHEHVHVHPHEALHSHEDGLDHTSDHDHAQSRMHDHGDGRVHNHLPPGADGAPVTWRSLLALGISGGLLPCPSALVVMLSAIALERVGFGLLLIVAFSLGLAGVLTAIGVLFVHAGRLMNRLQVSQRMRFGSGLIRFAPVVSALVISVAGLAVTYEALVQAGVVHGVALALPL